MSTLHNRTIFVLVFIGCIPKDGALPRSAWSDSDIQEGLTIGKPANESNHIGRVLQPILSFPPTFSPSENAANLTVSPSSQPSFITTSTNPTSETTSSPSSASPTNLIPTSYPFIIPAPVPPPFPTDLPPQICTCTCSCLLPPCNAALQGQGLEPGALIVKEA